MKTNKQIFAAGILSSLAFGWVALPVIAGQTESEAVQQGRYLVKIAGCNDCHTPGYLPTEGKVPEEQWLTGDSFGWHGPWGTTYATNLRLRMQELSEEEWVSYAKTLKARPPMPWFALNAMKDTDLQAIYQFTKHLGGAGSKSPAYLPPGQEPQPPFATFPAPPTK